MGEFSNRHNGLDKPAVQSMLGHLGLKTMEELIDQVIPGDIKNDDQLASLPEALSELSFADHIEELAAQNRPGKSFIGQGYYGTHLPAAIQRNILENPGWYTAYTPYQAEIAQGRLEALFNFQTVISELAVLPLANASLLDEGTAAAEAMSMLYAAKNKKRGAQRNKLLVDEFVFQQTKHVLRSRAERIGVDVEIINWKSTEIDEQVFAVIVQYPDARGSVNDYQYLVQKLEDKNIGLIVCADILSLTLFKAPGNWGADVVVGSTQRFGVPMWYGGPHAGYLCCKEEYKRLIPGRIIGLSKDASGDDAFRMALQTREQHIRREKATSNICTAQALLAIIAGTYALYHGPEGLREIARRIQAKAQLLASKLDSEGYDVLTHDVFDTVAVRLDSAKFNSLRKREKELGLCLYYLDGEVRLSLDELTTGEDMSNLLDLFGVTMEEGAISQMAELTTSEVIKRPLNFMQQPIFSSYRTETSLMRYLKRLENKDFSLVHGMIPLGSCTMKLNAAAQLLPLSKTTFAEVHPMVRDEDVEGYQSMINELAKYLCTITGLRACSFQPNSGAQGELAGLMAIQRYHEANGDIDRQVVLIPASAHGTNPASAVMAGMKVVIVASDERGNIDVTDLRTKAVANNEALAALMVTYPSTHGVYEQSIREVCQIVHDNGGLVYMDGANMNAQVGYTSPGYIGADVCHLNLHKTFAIPHGGGGPGMGPICVNEKLVDYLPKQDYFGEQLEEDHYAIASSQYGSASILLISYAYIRLLGAKGLKTATEQAILSANYLADRLGAHYDVLFRGENGRVAHEFIVDLREFKKIGIEAEDVAKRLIDYGFHAPTMSFPVPGTLMIEPTESENRAELDRFCESMIQIKQEIDEVAEGKYSAEDNVLVNAPHTLVMITSDEWPFPYARQKAAYPMGMKMAHSKFWPSVARVDNAYGDRNLICSCPPVEEYAEIAQ